MKRWIGAICALLLLPTLACGEAYTIGEVRGQVEELERWIQTYTDDYGREVAVDVAPIVPEAGAIPIKTMDNPVLPIEDVWKIFDPDMMKQEKMEDGIRMTYYNSDTNEKAVVYSCTIGGNLVFIQYDDLNTKIEGDPKELESYSGKLYCSNEVDRSYPYLSGYDLTVQNCIDRANENLQAFFPDYELDLDIVWAEVIPNTRALYACTLRQNVEDIPILMGAGDPVFGVSEKEIDFELPENWRHQGVVYWGSFIRSYYDFFAFADGGYQIQFRPLKQTGELAEDVPLCSLKEVIAHIEKQIENGHIRKIHAMRLGYCCYLGENEEIVLYPVWEVECDYFYNPRKEARNYREMQNIAVTNGLDYHTMIFNAQTGEFMDPIELKENLLDCPEIITWEDVQQ